ncbi:MAG: GNAT family N-acetyltransferase [Sphingobium sp.]
MNMVASVIVQAEAQGPVLLPVPAQRAACWRDLAEAACEPNPFFHPAILLPALDHLDPRRRVKVLEATDTEGRLIGLLPVVVRSRHGRYPVANVANWVHGQCFFGAPLLRRGHEVEAWAALLVRLDAARWANGFLHLEALAFDGPAAAALRQACAAQGRSLKLISTHQRAMLRSDLSADDYWQTHVRQKKRKELRRLASRLAELGSVTHRRFAEGGDVEQWARDFLTLEGSGWKGAEGTALASGEATRAYFTEMMVNAAAADMLAMLRIDLDDAPIAMLVNFQLGEGAYSYKIAFDERFSRFSPGVLVEIDNLRAMLSDPALAWMDSCAAPGHPMIDGLWAERRTIGQFRVALRGGGTRELRRRAVFAATGAAEHMVRAFRERGR